MPRPLWLPHSCRNCENTLVTESCDTDLRADMAAPTFWTSFGPICFRISAASFSPMDIRRMAAFSRELILRPSLSTGTLSDIVAYPVFHDLRCTRRILRHQALDCTQLSFIAVGWSAQQHIIATTQRNRIFTHTVSIRGQLRERYICRSSGGGNQGFAFTTYCSQTAQHRQQHTKYQQQDKYRTGTLTQRRTKPGLFPQRDAVFNNRFLTCKLFADHRYAVTTGSIKTNSKIGRAHV